jgi:hypothetical protein
VQSTSNMSSICKTCAAGKAAVCLTWATTWCIIKHIYETSSLKWPCSMLKHGKICI